MKKRNLKRQTLYSIKLSLESKGMIKIFSGIEDIKDLSHKSRLSKTILDELPKSGENISDREAEVIKCLGKKS